MSESALRPDPRRRLARMSRSEPVEISVGGATIAGDLVEPAPGGAVIVFAHGSGSSRHSPRNRAVAERLGRDGFGTLLLDLLTEREEFVDLRTREHRFDIELLAIRLAEAVNWLDRRSPRTTEVGYFGASTGAAAAIVAATRLGERVEAIVSRGGRPDLAGSTLAELQAPTLLIVGGRDEEVLELNRAAWGRMRCERRIEIVEGATHLFEERGALETVAALAAEWFGRHLTRRGTATAP